MAAAAWVGKGEIKTFFSLCFVNVQKNVFVYFMIKAIIMNNRIIAGIATRLEVTNSSV